MTEYFPYKDRIDRHKHRYVEAYKHGLDTIDDWLSAGPDSDTYTPSRKALWDVCKTWSGIEHWSFTDCGSDGIQAALGVFTKPGDDVIIPAWGFIATPQNIRWIDRKIIFCDNGRDAMMCPNSLALAIERYPNAKVVMPVHLLGRVQDIETLLPHIPSHMRIVEDAANAFYMNDPGNKPGMYSDATVYSFDIAKHPASTGTGGAVATSSKRTIDSIKELTQQGFKKHRDGFVAPATKSSMDDTTARVIFEDMIIMQETKVREARRANNKLFVDNIKREQLEGDNTICTGFGFFPEKLSAKEVQAKYRDAGIGVSVYPCFADMPAFADCVSAGHDYAKRLAKELVIPPLHEYLTHDDKRKIIEIANGV